ncbi:hypothetical protein T5B8_18598 [Salinisphaera sp. T5B8]
MDQDQLVDLWAIGRSGKRDDAREKRLSRTQIGKFGIGKLASYAVAHKLTYLTKGRDGRIRGATVDFRSFAAITSDEAVDVELPIYAISDAGEFLRLLAQQELLSAIEVSVDQLLSTETWTMAFLEDLKDDAQALKSGRVRWVLSTAMPLVSDFKIQFNKEWLESSKLKGSKIAEFTPAEISERRLENLNASTSDSWRIENDKLVSDLFPTGIDGNVRVFERSLRGKSEDLERSHGFFLKVNGRLINEHDPLFGLEPLSHATFNRMNAEICIDDLDPYLLSSREEIEDSAAKKSVLVLLQQIFAEARTRKESHDKEKFDKEKTKREPVRSYIEPRLVERPVADFLIASQGLDEGSEADDEWFYIKPGTGEQLEDTLNDLYSGKQREYSYQYEAAGSSNRVVQFDITGKTFYLNTDHEYIAANYDEASSRSLLEDFATSEALLEVYLRESDITPHVVGEVLERRDALFRGLARDHAGSLVSVARELNDSVADQYDLEVALVRAARALGFVAKHIAGAGEPDGLARLSAYPTSDAIITLEAKSSTGTPSLSAIDFAGLDSHREAYEAHGCLLIAPSYPGASLGDESEVAKRAKSKGISCWTVDQLAQFVLAAEARHITADDIVKIVTTKFAPADVSSAIRDFLSRPLGDKTKLYRAIVYELEKIQGRLKATRRTFDTLAARLIDHEGLETVEFEDVKNAVIDMAGASKGALQISQNNIIILTSIDELRRRLNGLLNDRVKSRSLGLFRKDNGE